MNRYSYRQNTTEPHAPYISLKLISPADASLNISCESLLDTGADSTFVPLSLLQKIKVKPAGKGKIFFSHAGQAESKPYVVLIQLDSQLIKPLEVWSWDNKFVLVGRDILNQYCIHLDGINLEFTFKYE